jgi:hypothetical protein
VVLLTVTLASRWYSASITISRVKAGAVGFRSVDVSIHDHSLSITHWPWRSRGHFDEIPEPGWHTNATLLYGRYMGRAIAWWGPPRTFRGGSSVGPYTEWQAPLLYPLILLAVITIWAAKRTTTRDSYSCKSCGYSLVGLDAPICPECGRTEPTP